MNFVMSLDLQQLQESLDNMNASRKNMYNEICALNTIRKRLLEGDVWSGEGATAVLNSYTDTLYKLLVEQKRLNALAYAIYEYIGELTKNEQETAKLVSANVTSSGGARSVYTAEMM